MMFEHWQKQKLCYFLTLVQSKHKIKYDIHPAKSKSSLSPLSLPLSHSVEVFLHCGQQRIAGCQRRVGPATKNKRVTRRGWKRGRRDRGRGRGEEDETRSAGGLLPWISNGRGERDVSLPPLKAPIPSHLLNGATCTFSLSLSLDAFEVAREDGCFSPSVNLDDIRKWFRGDLRRWIKMRNPLGHWLSLGRLLCLRPVNGNPSLN